jgi:hypothetical protein
MSANIGSTQFRRTNSTTLLAAVFATLLWGLDGVTIIPTRDEFTYAGILLTLIGIGAVVFIKSMSRLENPDGDKKRQAVVMIVVSSFALAGLLWVALVGWAGYEPRHAFAGMSAVIIVLFGLIKNRIRKGEEDDHPNEAEPDEQDDASRRKLADATA